MAKEKIEKDVTAVSELGLNIITVLKETGKPMTTRDIAASIAPDMTWQKVNGACLSLTKNGIVMRSEPTEVEISDKDGNPTKTSMKFVALTDFGKNTQFHVHAPKAE